MEKRIDQTCEEIAASCAEFHVPGIEQVIEELRQEYPFLSEAAIARILGLARIDASTFEQKRQGPAATRPEPAVEAPE